MLSDSKVLKSMFNLKVVEDLDQCIQRLRAIGYRLDKKKDPDTELLSISL